MFVTRKSLRSLLLASALASSVSACASVVPHPKVQQPPETGRVTFQPEESVITLPTSGENLLSISYDKGDPLPGDLIGPVEVKDMPLEDVLRVVTRAHKIPIAVGAGAEAAKVSISIPDRLPLAKIIDIVASQAGAFYEYRDGVLHVEGERSFSIKIPNVLGQDRYKDLTEQDSQSNNDDNGDNQNGYANTSGNSQDNAWQSKDPAKSFSTIDAFSDTFKSLGATDVTPNKRTGLVTLYADKNTYGQIAKFLRDFELNRDLIIYDTWIYEVQLSDAKQAGIDWKDFAKSINGKVDLNLNSGVGSTSSSSSSSGAASGDDASSDTIHLPTPGEALRGAGGLTLGVLGTPGAWAVDAMFSFLNGQGEAKTLAQPTIAVIGGREGGVYVGESIAYIKELKVENDNTNADGTTNTTTSSSNTATDVKTRTLKTGYRLGITGDMNNGVVETDVNLSFVELLSLTDVSIKGYVLQLPRTAQRSLYTTVRSRPGDVIMLGGLIYDRGTRSQDNLMVGNVPLKAAAEGNRNELVMMLRPRIVKFRPGQKDMDKAFKEAPVVVGPSTLPADAAQPTTIVTPEAPQAVRMKKSSSTEQQVIDGIKADPTSSDLANEAKTLLDGQADQNAASPAAPAQPAKPAPLPAPTQVAPSSAAKPTAPSQKQGW